MFTQPKYVDMPEDWEKNFGRYNDAPPNFKEISEAEFSQSKFFVYSPEYVEYRQIDPKQISPKEKYFLGVRLFYFFDGTGLGMAHDYWAKKVRYFKFTKCEHDTEELSGHVAAKYVVVHDVFPPTSRLAKPGEQGVSHFGNCYHVYRCKKCGFIESVDTSG